MAYFKVKQSRKDIILNIDLINPFKTTFNNLYFIIILFNNDNKKKVHQRGPGSAVFGHVFNSKKLNNQIIHLHFFF